MHILMIPSWYGTLENALRGIFFREQAEALRDAGHKVGIIALDYHPVKTTLRDGLLPSIGCTEENGIRVYRIRQQRGILDYPRLHLPILRLFALNAYRRYERENGRPDVIQAQGALYGGYAAVLIKEKYAQPVVLTEHSSAFLRGLIGKRDEWIITYTLKRTDRNYAVSSSLAHSVMAFVPTSQVDVCGNMVDGDFFTLSPHASAPDRRFIFASIGGLNKNKGLNILLRAFAQVSPERNACLWLAGGGEEMDNLKAMAGQLAIADRVEFLGRLDRSQVRTMLHEANALVSSSYAETFGINLIEAMACGKPVVSTRSGGPEDFVDDSNGVLVQPGDVPALASALERMIETASNYDPAKIRMGILAKFGREGFVQRMEGIYQDVIQK